MEQAEGKKTERLGDEQHRERFPQDGDKWRGDGQVEPDQVGKGIRENEYRNVEYEFYNPPQAQDDIHRRGQPTNNSFAKIHESPIRLFAISIEFILFQDYRKNKR